MRYQTIFMELFVGGRITVEKDSILLDCIQKRAEHIIDLIKWLWVPIA